MFRGRKYEQWLVLNGRRVLGSSIEFVDGEAALLVGQLMLNPSCICKSRLAFQRKKTTKQCHHAKLTL